jgi:hypothetical protein
MIPIGRWSVALSVFLANIVALRFTLTELRWIKIHQARASAVLRLVFPEVIEMQKFANAQWYGRAESGDNRARFTSSMALQVLHWLMVVAALVMGIFVTTP